MILNAAKTQSVLQQKSFTPCMPENSLLEAHELRCVRVMDRLSRTRSARKFEHESPSGLNGRGVLRVTVQLVSEQGSWVASNCLEPCGTWRFKIWNIDSQNIYRHGYHSVPRTNTLTQYLMKGRCGRL